MITSVIVDLSCLFKDLLFFFQGLSLAVQSENAIEEERRDNKVNDSSVICRGVPGDGEKNIVAADVDVKDVQREQQRNDAAEMLDA